MQGLASTVGISFDSFALPPTNSPSPNNSEDSFPEHDLLPLDDTATGASEEPNVKRKGKRPASTAERRATHNAVERARRESLNGRFMELAGALPNMASVKRPSKSAIVAKSLEFVQGAQAREQYLMGQNDTLRSEINELRARLGMPALSASPAGNAPSALPAVQQRTRKASSVSSITTDTSSPLVGTPALQTGSFVDASAGPRTPAGYSFNSAFASSFPEAVTAQANQPAQATPNSAPASLPASKPATPPAGFQAAAMSGLDVNYLMALSMQQQHQQQQQQNMLHLQNMPPSYNAAVAPWLMAHRQPHMPVAVGGDSSWLFS